MATPQTAADGAMKPAVRQEREELPYACMGMVPKKTKRRHSWGSRAYAQLVQTHLPDHLVGMMDKQTLAVLSRCPGVPAAANSRRSRRIQSLCINLSVILTSHGKSPVCLSLRMQAVL